METASVRFDAPSFEQIMPRCCFTASGEIESVRAMSLFVSPRMTNARISKFALNMV